MILNKKIYQAEGIEIKQSPLHGQGVFALKEFRAGEIIEIAPVILLGPGEREELQTTSLFSYYFLLKSKKKPVALGLGYSSLYNHLQKANAAYSVSLKNATITIRAYKNILPGEEITLNYNGTPGDESPVYFPSLNSQ
ncbi:MAG: SET domain-containing protein-lysine N-methyltransferase [Bacteroidetes bacterium]|nr:SET domain-containing protein-lysine N-methyltransferase [Bacteroidota bacterium]